MTEEDMRARLVRQEVAIAELEEQRNLLGTRCTQLAYKAYLLRQRLAAYEGGAQAADTGEAEQAPATPPDKQTTG